MGLITEDFNPLVSFWKIFKKQLNEKSILNGLIMKFGKN